jgi:DNA-binding MarR family transcriptional regulator
MNEEENNNVEEKDILLYVKNFDDYNALELMKKMSINQKELEERMKGLEKKGLIKLTWGDEDIGDGESIDYIHWIELTEKGKKLLEGK